MALSAKNIRIIMEYKRKDDSTVQVIAERIDNLHSHISDLRDSMKESMKEMATAVNKLVKIEEGQVHMMQAHIRLTELQDKQVQRCDELEKRLDALEADVPMNRQIRNWVISAVTGIVALVGMGVAKFFGVM